MALAPIVGVADQLDGLVALELHELERSGADRLRAHVLGRDVTGIDRRVAGGEQGEEGGLRTPEDEAHLMVAVGDDLFQIVPPDFARVLSEFVLCLAACPSCTRRRWP